ncbi:MAG: hypothetical protein C0621_11010 [Desulfuromonas sp.]|nr:MAG: hypothetical protein C0621_11010 [Desulfuromonas sp.]
MSKSKKLSNPFSTGGGGGHFEAHIQASFVALMLSGGHAPCLPCWPIKEIKLQGKIDGFDTDDLVVFVEDGNSKERRKLLGQIKHSVKFTQSSPVLKEVIQAAWNDFNNHQGFTRDKDIIVLITGPLSATDEHNVQWLLNQARHTKDADEFLRNVKQTNFSPTKSVEKLGVIQHHLKHANDSKEVCKDELYAFLNHFHLIGYDLGNEFGVVLSLLHSHISQFQQQNPQWVWARIVDIVQTWNQDSGTITPSKLPEDLRNAFKQKVVSVMPEKLKTVTGKPKVDWTQHPDASYLAMAVLIGAWNDQGECDLETVSALLGISYGEWLNKAREILHCTDSPLSLHHGIWKVVNRSELWSLLGSRVLDQNLETFRTLAVSVLREPDPAFELPAEERYAASIYGKVMSCSRELRKGVAEGLAILGSRPEACENCSRGVAASTSIYVIRELLTDADWVLWGSLNDLLPTLAEAAPNQFLEVVEGALRLRPCPFDELFSQEGSGITGRNYLTGLLWALECLAWDDQYLVRVCVTLSELASHDPGGKWGNRPSNSLATILLPWLPQTMATVEKRNVAVRTLLTEWPDIAWGLILQLLPSQLQTSSGTYKPSWLGTIPASWESGVTYEEYWTQSSFYAGLAVEAAGLDVNRLSVLVDHFDDLPEPAFEKLLQVLGSQQIISIAEELRLIIWGRLMLFTNKHRRYSDAKWALSDELISRIEHVSERLAPTNPFYLYQHLFSDQDFDLYDDDGDWDHRRKKLDERRDNAISEIFQQKGADGVISFGETVPSGMQVGYAIAVIDDNELERYLLHKYLDTNNNKQKALIGSFIGRRFHQNGWEWCEALDKSAWTLGQIGHFLACLPFGYATWDHVSSWLQEQEREYWIRTGANAYHADGDLAFAIEKLMQYGRPHAAINCLYVMRQEKQTIDSSLCIHALLAAISSCEPSHALDTYHIVELIKFLQAEPSVDQDGLFRVEWAYVPLLDRHLGGGPQFLEHRLANDPDFFCELIQLIYRSKKEDQSPGEVSEKSKEVATNAWRLLRKWEMPPGTQKDGTFNQELFEEWLQRIKDVCSMSGHLEVALIKIGEVLIHTPPDLSGLWINKIVASALNDRDAEDMRRGFTTGTHNSRGAHVVDPTGSPERELASKYRKKAEDVENAGFHRFAVTLRIIAEGYDRDADRIVAEALQRGAEE